MKYGQAKLSHFLPWCLFLLRCRHCIDSPSSVPLFSSVSLRSKHRGDVCCWLPSIPMIVWHCRRRCGRFCWLPGGQSVVTFTSLLCNHWVATLLLGHLILINRLTSPSIPIFSSIPILFIFFLNVCIFYFCAYNGLSRIVDTAHAICQPLSSLNGRSKLSCVSPFYVHLHASAYIVHGWQLSLGQFRFFYYVFIVY
jgi:hypothetical protein